MKYVKNVIGANYGDEGKGLATRYFCLKTNNPIVIFYQSSNNRGATIEKPDGFKIQLRHLSAGTFDNISTYFAKDFVINPVELEIEYYNIIFKNQKIPPLYVDTNCRIITPVDELIDRIRIIYLRKKGLQWHSTGIGTNSVYLRQQHKELDFKYKDFLENDPFELCNYIFDNWFYQGLKEFEINEIPDLFEIYKTKEKNIIGGFYEKFVLYKETINNLKEILIPKTFDEIYHHYDTLIFEPNAGLRLGLESEIAGIYRTAAYVGITNTIDLLKPYSDYIGEACYLTRPYITKHGAGPMPEETKNIYFYDELNDFNFKQGLLRFGEFNYNDFLKRCKKDFLQAPNNWKMTTMLTHVNELDIPEKKLFNYLSYTKYAEDIIINE